MNFNDEPVEIKSEGLNVSEMTQDEFDRMIDDPVSTNSSDILTIGDVSCKVRTFSIDLETKTGRKATISLGDLSDSLVGEVLEALEENDTKMGRTFELRTRLFTLFLPFDSIARFSFSDQGDDMTSLVIDASDWKIKSIKSR